MSTADIVKQHTLLVASGETVIFTDPSASGTTYDYRYYRLLVTGAYDATTTMTLNGIEMIVAGGTMLDIPIWGLSVTAGVSVVLFGNKSVKEVFGN